MIPRTPWLRAGFAVLFVCAAGAADAHDGRYEVWAVDQSGTAGTLYVYDGRDLTRDPATAVPEVVDLGATVAPLCAAQTGSTPVRAHMLDFDPQDRYAILAYVASGHVVFIEAATRTPVTCIDVGVQAHAAMASPDGRYVVVANQNGKLLQRIATDYDTGSFTLDGAATLDLASCTTPSGAACQDAVLRPDNAPICPIVDDSSRFVFLTLRGGGLFVVDGRATPMRIVAEYDKDTVRGNGCGGVQRGHKMYVNAGGGTAGNPTENDLYAFDLSDLPHDGAAPPNQPAPTTIYVMDDGAHDGHGMVLNRFGHGRFLWVADRLANQVMVVDTRRDELVGVFDLAGDVSSDPAPDLIERSPDGRHAFAALRGPCPLTANVAAVNNAVGATPGVGVIDVDAGGRSGRLAGVAPIRQPSDPFVCTSVGGAPTLTERADPHAVKVRRTRRHGR